MELETVIRRLDESGPVAFGSHGSLRLLMERTVLNIRADNNLYRSIVAKAMPLAFTGRTHQSQHHGIFIIQNFLFDADLDKHAVADGQFVFPDAAAIVRNMELFQTINCKFLDACMMHRPHTETPQHDMTVHRIIRVQIAEQNGIVTAPQLIGFDGHPDQTAASVRLKKITFVAPQFITPIRKLELFHIFRQNHDRRNPAFQFFRAENGNDQLRLLVFFRNRNRRKQRKENTA